MMPRDDGAANPGARAHCRCRFPAPPATAAPGLAWQHHSVSEGMSVNGLEVARQDLAPGRSVAYCRQEVVQACLPTQQASRCGVRVELPGHARLHRQPQEYSGADQCTLGSSLADEVLGDEGTHYRNKKGEFLRGDVMMLEPVTERFAEPCKVKWRASLMQSDATEDIIQHRPGFFDDLLCVHDLIATRCGIRFLRLPFERCHFATQEFGR